MRERLTPYFVKHGVAFYETVSSRSLVRTGSKAAKEYNNSILIEENASKGVFYEIEDSKYALDLTPAEPFSRLRSGDQMIRRVSHKGNIYQNWATFTDKSENLAVLEFQTNTGNFKVAVYVRSPEYLPAEKVLQFRIRFASRNILPKNLSVDGNFLDFVRPVEFFASKLVVVP